MSSASPVLDEITALSPGQVALLTAARADGDLKAIPPLAMTLRATDDADVTDPESLLRPCLKAGPSVNPLLAAALIELGANQVGERSFTLAVGKDADPRALHQLVEVLPMTMVYGAEHVTAGEKNGFEDFARFRIIHTIAEALCNTPQGATLNKDDLIFAMASVHLETAGYAEGAVIVSVAQNTLRIKIVTNGGRQGLFLPGVAELELGRLPHAAARPLAAMRPDEAIRVMATARHLGWPIADPDNILAAYTTLLERSVSAHVMPGAPALTRLAVGRTLKHLENSKGEVVALPDAVNALAEVNGTPAPLPCALIELPAEEAAPVLASAREQDAVTALDPNVEDVVSMAVAVPTQHEALRPYQNLAVGLHQSTRLGFVNALAQGLGKTITTLVAYRDQWLATPDGRFDAYISVPAALRTQWSEEIAVWFPEAELLVITSTKNVAKQIADASERAREGKKALLVLASTLMLANIVDDVIAHGFDDAAIDQAEFLVNTSSKQTQAHWRLRMEGVRRVVPLTGSPIRKNRDDLGSLVAFTRADRTLFHRDRKLTRQFEATEEGATGLRAALGPTVFRRDRSEIADELPTINAEVIVTDVEPAQLALAKAARDLMRESLDEARALTAKLELLAPGDPARAALIAAKEEARRRAMTSIDEARRAASDAEAVSESTTAAAATLRERGLIAKALKKPPVKRQQAVETAKAYVDDSGSVLVFTCHTAIAKHLVADFHAAGVSAALFAGGMSDKQRTDAREGFQSGKYDVLVLTAAGYKGLNLQRTTAIINFDLPWSVADIIERIARADRLGAGARPLDVITMSTAGTIEEPIAAKLMVQAVESYMVLDAGRGVRGSQTDLGRAVAGLGDAVSLDERAGLESVFELAAYALNN